MPTHDDLPGGLAEIICDVKQNDRPWLRPSEWSRLGLASATGTLAQRLHALLQPDLAPYIARCRTGEAVALDANEHAHGDDGHTIEAEAEAEANHNAGTAAGEQRRCWRSPAVMTDPPTRQLFVDAAENPNVPVVMRNLTAKWKAAAPAASGEPGSRWAFQNMRERFPDSFFRVSDTHGAVVTLDEYAQYAESTTDDCPFGLYDSQFGDDERHDLVGEYHVPECLNQDLFQKCDARPPFRWILIGPRRSGTAMHVDPLLTHAWVTLLQGAKRWCLFPAGTPRELLGCWVEVHGSFVDKQPTSSSPRNDGPSTAGGAEAPRGEQPSSERAHIQGGRGRRAAVAAARGDEEAHHNGRDAEEAQPDGGASSRSSPAELPRLNAAEWFLKVYPSIHAADSGFPAKYRPIEVLQLPGDTVYVPAGWPHVVLNVGAMNVAVTHNFATANGPYGSVSMMT